MDRAVLLRFHDHPAVCRANVALLRALNPGVPVYGVGERLQDETGDEDGDRGELDDGDHGGLDDGDRGGLVDGDRGSVEDALDHLHVVREHDDHDPDALPHDWHWRHGDRVVAHWHEHVGRDRAFDRLVVVEYDLLLAAPLDALYGHVPADAVAVSGRRPMAEARADGWAWVTTHDSPTEYAMLRAHLADTHAHHDPAPACVFPGCSLPRRFLDAYAALDPPLLGNDEVRLTHYAAALDHEIVDTGFHEWAADPPPDFNCRGRTVDRDRVLAALDDPAGRRTFHPVRDPGTYDAVRERIV